MATSTEIKNNNNTLIREKTAPSSITKDNVADQLDAIVDYVDQEKRPYKVYSILISQDSLNIPTAKVLENNTGFTFTFTRTATGNYNIVSSGSAYTADKTAIFFQDNSQGATKASMNVIRNSATNVRIFTYADAVASDSMITDVFLEIRVYP